MKNLTVTLPDETYQHLRVAAAKQGKSMSRLVGELVERRIGRPISKVEAMRRFLDGPLMDLTDENGKAPTRDQIYDR
jgi:plasmid stability protein